MSFTNTRTVRIEWGDCDPAGIIFYPTYFRIFDNATEALFERALGMTKFQYLKAYDFAGFPLVDTRARFLRPTRCGDDVTVESTIAFRTSSFTVQHRISLAGVLCAEGTETRVWAVRDPTRRLAPQAVPTAVRARFNGPMLQGLL